MRISCITVFCNEEFRLDNWKRYYQEYKDELYLHVIVNNGSSEDTPLLKYSFPNSIVLESQGGNLLAAYNIGLQYCLRDASIDAIMQITNDVRFKENAISEMYDLLFSDASLAVVGPVLLRKDSDVVESFGIDYPCSTIDRGGQQTFPYQGNCLHEIPISVRRVSYVPAGTILMKRSAIEKMGFQDETLIMYCDERDMAIRLYKLGYYEAVTKKAVAWHQHINRPGCISRSLYAPFFSSRNCIYLIRKHSNLFWAINQSVKVIVYMSLLMLYHLLCSGEDHKLRSDKAAIYGTLYGLFLRMETYPKWLSCKY